MICRMKLILSNKNNLEIFEKKLYRMDFLYSFFVHKEIKFIFFKLFEKFNLEKIKNYGKNY